MKSMRMPTTFTLVLLSLCLFAATGLLLRGVTTIRPIHAPNGEIMRAPDGRMLMEPDPLGQFLVNWDAYACAFGSAFFFAWVLARMCRLAWASVGGRRVESQVPPEL